MADVNIAKGAIAAHNVSLVANTEKSVEFGDDLAYVEVVVHSATNPVYFSVDKKVVAVAGANAYAIPATAGASAAVGIYTGGKTLVRLISGANASVTVTRAPQYRK